MKGIDYFSDLSDLENAVFTIFFGTQVKIEGNLTIAIR
jgi:hypothetical protein